jgi:hypothetical protein
MHLLILVRHSIQKGQASRQTIEHGFDPDSNEEENYELILRVCETDSAFRRGPHGRLSTGERNVCR